MLETLNRINEPKDLKKISKEEYFAMLDWSLSRINTQ